MPLAPPFLARTWHFRRVDDGWTLDGGPAWMRPDVGWVMAHDVVHHRPHDTGSYLDEVASVGAQWYLDHPLTHEHDVHELAGTLGQVMLMAYETWGGQGLLAKGLLNHENVRSGAIHTLDPGVDGPIDQHPFNDSHESHESKDSTASKDANDHRPPMDQTAETLHRTAMVTAARAMVRKAWALTLDDLGPYALEPDEQAWVLGDAHQTALAEHLVNGWIDAAQRWPDRDAAQQLFTTVCTALSAPAPLNTRVSVTREPGGLLLVETVHDGMGPDQWAAAIEAEHPQPRARALGR